MINYFENDYAVPVILGNGIEELNAASVISNRSNKEIYVFADKLSLLKRIKYTFHKLPKSNILTLTALMDFSASLHEYFTPILIYGKDFSEFIENNRSELESIYITVHANEIEKYFTNTQKE